jgi:hypothetical protein
MNEPALKIAVAYSMTWLENQPPQICVYLLLLLCLLVAFLIWRASIDRSTAKKSNAATVAAYKVSVKWHSLSARE